jgi:hypothetical protein
MSIETDTSGGAERNREPISGFWILFWLLICWPIAVYVLWAERGERL